MEFLNVAGFSVPAGKNREFQEWVRDNSEALANAAPEGIELVGFYGSIFSSEKHSGFYKVIWRHGSYGAMDQFAAAAGGDTEFAKLLDEVGAFGDVRIGADFSGELLKSVSDLSIWADYPESQ